MTAILLVFGNEKGGSGKSTTAIQVTIGLLRLGYTVGSIDLDARQGTFTRFFSNRFAAIQKTRLILPCPNHMPLEAANFPSVKDSETHDRDFFLQAVSELSPLHDFIIIDTAGANTFLGQLAHARADIIITPLNDSGIDLDVIARRDLQTKDILNPSIYTRMVLDQRREAQVSRNVTPRWIVLRNRLIKNQDHIGLDLKALAEKFGFELIHGFHENVKFRDLFKEGLGVLDPQINTTLEDLTAKQDIRQLLRSIDPVRYKGYRNVVR